MNFNKILQSLFGNKSTRDMKLIQPIVAQESVTVKGTWSEDRIYCPYPTTDGEKNPNLKR